MGNRIGKCFEGAGEVSRRHDIAAAVSGTLDEGLGHSFCYIRPGGSDQLPSSMVHSEESNSQTTTFRSISGASVSANTSTPLSTSLIDLYAHGNAVDKASTFNSSISFASIPLQPVPRNSNFSADFPGSGPMERGFLSGPIERGILSGPIDRGILSGPIERDLFSERDRDQLQRSSFSGFGAKSKLKNRSLGKSFKRAIMKVFSKRAKGTVWNREIEWVREKEKSSESNIFSSENTTNLSSGGSLSNDVDEDDFSMESHNLQWAHGKAGEDRVHIVVSEEFGWVFVGIYDGFNGPDAPDFLLSHLYSNVHKELKGLLWNDKLESEMTHFGKGNSSLTRECGYEFHHFGIHCGHEREAKTPKNQSKGAGRKWEQNQKRWRCEWDRERLELDRRLKEQMGRSSSGHGSGISHSDIMKALSQALRKTEEAYLEIADKMVMENPELLLMGSCALVMLMKGEDVYLMNVGDSRAVLAQKPEPDLGFGKATHDLEFINEETLNNLESIDGRLPSLCSLQLTMDHSTYVEEEVERIRNEHSNDASAIMNDRVKGYLKVTRAFGAGFLKQPKWNDALLEMFRIDYVGTSPYITCSPSLHHHRLNPRDAFLILSSDGLYQYFTNQEAISEVELFMSSSPEGDPAQHLIEEVLFRAAKKAGMDFHELLDIPQGDRRRYHDDVSVIIISLEGRIWRSSV